MTRETLLDRFIKYAKIDTQSSEESTTFPSTEKQKDLAREILNDLKNIGIADVKMDEYGYVTATLASNLSQEESKKIPTIAFIGHLDTTPEYSGANVKPQIVRNYQGGDIILKGDPTQKITVQDSPNLKHCIGHDIITSDGTTLLGVDNKAGIAEIVEAFKRLEENRNKYKHGKVKLLITPDEEVGRGIEKLNLDGLADYAYTVDGFEAGCLQYETFCADTAIITATGINTHPGYAKSKGMVNAVRVISNIINNLPLNISPEQTDDHEGYLHPYVLEGGVSNAKLTILVRDFTIEGLKQKEVFLEKIVAEAKKRFVGASIKMEIKESYRNMKYKIEEDMRVVEYAKEAMQKAGLVPAISEVRGGTDGAQLSYKGLLTPNIFCGEQNFHMLTEWTSLQWMDKAVETIVELVQVWAEKSLK